MTDTQKKENLLPKDEDRQSPLHFKVGGVDWSFVANPIGYQWTLENGRSGMTPYILCSLLKLDRDGFPTKRYTMSFPLGIPKDVLEQIFAMIKKAQKIPLQETQKSLS